jgi:hypothetical protein
MCRFDRGQVLQYGHCFPQDEFAIPEGGDESVWIDRQKLRLALLAVEEIHPLHIHLAAESPGDREHRDTIG